MSEFISNHPLTLQLLMDEDLYFIPEQNSISFTPPEITKPVLREEDKNINPEEPTTIIQAIDFDNLKYFGNRDSKVILMVSDPDYPVCAAPERDLFKNICSAMQWTANDYMVINTAQNKNYTAETWLSVCKPSILILFDVPETAFSKNMALNNVQQFEQTKIIKTQSLASLNQNRNYKVSFWNELKKIK